MDGKERGKTDGGGILAGTWGYKASIGYYDFDDRRLNGWIDEFIMYDFALSEEQIFSLLGKMRCPTGNTTSIEIDAFKFENVNVKRSVNEKEESLIFQSRKLIHKRQISTNYPNKKSKKHHKKLLLHNNKIANIKLVNHYKNNSIINTSIYAAQVKAKRSLQKSALDSNTKRINKLPHR